MYGGIMVISVPQLLLNLDHLVLVEVFLVAGYFFANLYQSALGGWNNRQ